MGTHPIFESDFDCLTDNKMKLIDPFIFASVSAKSAITSTSCSVPSCSEYSDQQTMNCNYFGSTRVGQPFCDEAYKERYGNVEELRLFCLADATNKDYMIQGMQVKYTSATSPSYSWTPVRGTDDFNYGVHLTSWKMDEPVEEIRIWE